MPRLAMPGASAPHMQHRGCLHSGASYSVTTIACVVSTAPGTATGSDHLLPGSLVTSTALITSQGAVIAVEAAEAERALANGGAAPMHD